MHTRTTVPRTTWTADTKAHALELYVEHGAAEASRRTGIPKGTINSWANRNGVQTLAVVNDRRSTEAAVARRKRTLEERRVVLVEKLGELAELGVDWTVKALEDADSAGISVRDAIGAFTRAIHDLQLLSGEATSRNEHADPRARLAGLKDELAERRNKQAS